jgi:hypothetical protein
MRRSRFFTMFFLVTMAGYPLICALIIYAEHNPAC